MIKKIILGTANFQNKYGINNKCISTIKEIKNIKKIAEINKITEIDTAFSYKAEKKLKNFNEEKWKINTKIPTINLQDNIKETIFSMIKKSLKVLKKKNFESILLHNPNQIFNKKGYEIIKSLVDLKKKGLIKKIGFSVYRPIELNKLIKIFKPDLVQIPINIADRRFQCKGFLNKLKESGIEIHARSIFLQGLLTLEASERPNFFYPWKKELEKWDEYILQNNFNRIKVCLDFVNSIKEIDKFIVGFNSASQFDEIIKNYREKQIKKFFIFDNLNTKFLMPTKWKI